jgi:hypothetical protein
VNAFLWAGAAVAIAGGAALVWCGVEAGRLKREEIPRDEVQRRLQRLVAANAGALAVAFLGLGLMVVGAVM